MEKGVKIITERHLPMQQGSIGGPFSTSLGGSACRVTIGDDESTTLSVDVVEVTRSAGIDDDDSARSMYSKPSGVSIFTIVG